MRRVVRRTRPTPSRFSIADSRLLTAAVLTLSSRAAAVRLPVLASAAKKASSSGCSRADIVDCKLRMH